jgi:hypothetical protein
MTVLLGIFVLIVLYKLALMREEKASIKKTERNIKESEKFSKMRFEIKHIAEAKQNGQYICPLTGKIYKAEDYLGKMTIKSLRKWGVLV